MKYKSWRDNPKPIARAPRKGVMDTAAKDIYWQPNREVLGRGEPQLGLPDRRRVEILTEFAEAQGLKVRCEPAPDGYHVIAELHPEKTGGKGSGKVGFHDARGLANKKRTKASPITLGNIRAARRSGLSFRDIAERFGISKSAAYRYAKDVTPL